MATLNLGISVGTTSKFACEGIWSRGMILALGARGLEFDSRNAPISQSESCIASVLLIRSNQNLNSFSASFSVTSLISLYILYSVLQESIFELNCFQRSGPRKLSVPLQLSLPLHGSNNWLVLSSVRFHLLLFPIYAFRMFGFSVNVEFNFPCISSPHYTFLKLFLKLI